MRVGPEGLPQGEHLRRDLVICHRFATGNRRNEMLVLLLPMEYPYQQHLRPDAFFCDLDNSSSMLQHNSQKSSFGMKKQDG